jgi:multimeric flavodoxin WrbA
MKIVGVSGSPRKGNTEWMLNRFLEVMGQNGAEIELILLRQKDIRRCTGCLICENRKGVCQIKDDMQSIYSGLLGADAIVLGSPAYFEMVSGLLKNFMDRTCPIWTQMKGKPIAGLAVAEEGIGRTVDNLKTYASVCGMLWVGSVTVLAKKPGEAAENKSVEQRIKRLAKKLGRQCQSNQGASGLGSKL